MSITQYDAGSIHIKLEGQEAAERVLGDLKEKLPAVTKVAINSTARYARKEMVSAAKARYALNARGRQRLSDLKQTKKATNRDLSAKLFSESMGADMGYYESRPSRAMMGKEAFQAPSFFKGHVIRANPMEDLTGKGNLSKGFLLEFASGHTGMVQRVIGSSSRNNITRRSGVPRWRNRRGKVEKLRTYDAPSATAIFRTVWPEVEQNVDNYLSDRMYTRAEEVVAMAAARAKARR